MLRCAVLSLLVGNFWAFSGVNRRAAHSSTMLLRAATVQDEREGIITSSRRRVLEIIATSAGSTLVGASTAHADGKSFTPGGTLVDFEVGVTVGNYDASPSRKADNTNVIFTQDHYFKFGKAPPWIEPGSTTFPKTMPFVLSQQRYDGLKKYGPRVKAGIQQIDSLGDAITNGDEIADPSDPKFALRPMGLLANTFMASENTGTTNELLLARWYINEIYLQIGDIKSASNKDDAMRAYRSAKKSANSYLGMLNRVITEKVGEKIVLMTV